MNNLQELRAAIRSGEYTGNTSGLMPNLVQANVVIMPKALADEFVEFCQLNAKACPVIGVSEAGNPAIPTLGHDLDIRIDIPEYHLFEKGEYQRAVTDIKDYWQDDSVATVLGCSFSFENALQSAGLTVKNISLGRNVSMYNTHIPTLSTPHFSCNMVVSMRPYKREDIDAVVRITEAFPKAHGGPIHIGDPAAIGINDIDQPEYGDAVPIAHDETPVFWACGVTAQAAVKYARLPLVFSHAPGKMLITDLTYDSLP